VCQIKEPKNTTQCQQSGTQASHYPNKEKGFSTNYKNYNEKHNDSLYTTKRKEA